MSNNDLTDKSNDIIVDSVSYNVSISTGYQQDIHSVSKTGYTPLAIAGINLGSGAYAVNGVWGCISGLDAILQINGNASATTAFTVFVLYKKN